MAYKINKKAQVTIWVLVALAIVALILILLVINIKPKITVGYDSTNPEAFIYTCIKDSVFEVDDRIFEHGGFVNPKNSVSYYNVSLTYLCKNIGNYKSCINQHPALLDEIKSQIADYIKPEVNNCFEQLVSSLNKKGYIVNLEDNSNIDISLAPEQVQISIPRKLSYDYKDGAKSFDGLKFSFDEPMYDIMNVVIEIVNQEASYCYFEYNGYMLTYPRFKITKDVLEDSTKIYSVEDRNSGRKTQFAVRGCAIPPGI